jgi:hypothetical protein
MTRGSRERDAGDALAAAFVGSSLPMLNNVSLATALDLRRKGKLSAFRLYLQEVWAATSDASDDVKSAYRERALADRLSAEHTRASEEWAAIYKDLGEKGPSPFLPRHWRQSLRQA